MAKLVRFEELEVWQRARAIAGGVYRLSAGPPLSRDFGLKDQLPRAAVSVMSNIAEGFESNSPGSFLRYSRIAKASLAEVRSLLYVADDSGQVTASTRKQLLEQIEELGRMLGGLIRALGHRLRVKSVR